MEQHTSTCQTSFKERTGFHVLQLHGPELTAMRRQVLVSIEEEAEEGFSICEHKQTNIKKYILVSIDLTSATACQSALGESGFHFQAKCNAIFFFFLNLSDLTNCPLFVSRFRYCVPTSLFVLFFLSLFCETSCFSIFSKS